MNIFPKGAMYLREKIVPLILNSTYICNKETLGVPTEKETHREELWAASIAWGTKNDRSRFP